MEKISHNISQLVVKYNYEKKMTLLKMDEYHNLD